MAYNGYGTTCYWYRGVLVQFGNEILWFWYNVLLVQWVVSYSSNGGNELDVYGNVTAEQWCIDNNKCGIGTL